MAWIQISITANQRDADAIEAQLLALGALSVSLQDAGDQPILEPAPGATPMWEHAVITGTFAADIDSTALCRQLTKALGLAANDVQVETLPEQDWTRAWMDHYSAMSFGQRLWVCPWHQPPPNAHAINLRLDPGLAFGTGTHATTALCLRWLDANIQQPAHVLDFGCGSGILAIAALLLGAEHADGVDIDEQALIASHANASANAVHSRLTLYLPAAFNADTRLAAYDIVLANILSGPLLTLAITLSSYVKPGGHIVLSGILREQADEVSAAYSTHFHLDAPQFEDDWVLLHGCKKS